MALFESKTQKIPSTLLKDKYGWPPFSILNTISWDWQRRKDEWEAIIGDSTDGRDTKRFNATPVNTFSARGTQAKDAESVSTFDPYLCELMYRWFSLPGAHILDPFAGGCVRGLVAAVLGRHYDGIDLSLEQVKANTTQLYKTKARYIDIAGSATWLHGDALELLSTYDPLEDSCTHVFGGSVYDMVFTCPPYYNLERYTKDPRDLSNAENYSAFLNKYSDILYKSSRMLKEDSFFVIVVSEVRENSQSIAQSQYVGLVPDTVQILRDQCSLHYYNEIILENAIGSLPIRAPKYFTQTRKIGRHHQNVLVFYKGDLTHIEDKFGKESF